MTLSYWLPTQLVVGDDSVVRVRLLFGSCPLAVLPLLPQATIIHRCFQSALPGPPSGAAWALAHWGALVWDEACAADATMALGLATQFLGGPARGGRRLRAWEARLHIGLILGLWQVVPASAAGVRAQLRFRRTVFAVIAFTIQDEDLDGLVVTLPRWRLRLGDIGVHFARYGAYDELVPFFSLLFI
jgi:hypothetical protein